MDVIYSYLTPTRIGQPAADKRAVNNVQTTPSRSRWQLLKAFLAWKLLLLAIACASPGPGYDTSTDIFLASSNGALFHKLAQHFATRLTRWDALYFVSASQHGKLFEQEWAFSWAQSQLSALLARVIPQLSPILAHASSGIAISHMSHLLSVLVLYQFAVELLPGAVDTRKKLALKAACLHIVSPASLFLAAPYSEATFALFNFTGMLCYVYATQTFRATSTSRSVFWTLAAGVSFGLSCLFRSNGLLSGLIFAWDAASMLHTPPQSSQDVRCLLSTMFAGVSTGLGFLAPQVVAYFEYCTAGHTRPWCDWTVPSIYSWVQSEYWNVGFLKYWTVSNLPLFLLAAPMLVVLIGTAVSALGYQATSKDDTAKGSNRGPKDETSSEGAAYQACVRRFALPQLVLALLALFNFHVQIITRLSSGYPVWYLMVAVAIDQKAGATQLVATGWPADLKTAQYVVRGMIMYALIQGGLFASFLPPA
ncbi:hypothetical protein MBLNU230_g4605t1 [Neophaeotheca triangularis]